MSERQQTTFSGDELGLDVDDPDAFHIRVDFSDEDVMAAPMASVDMGAPGEFPEPAAAPMPMGRSAQEIEARSRSAISAAMNTIREMAIQTDAMLEKIPGGAQPRMIKVKFGVQLDFQVGAVLAKSGVGAALEVELEWARAADDVLRLYDARKSEA